ncbi:omega-amidase NIT2-like isoform X2 [Mya arenaria]|uniref:omega-amidase NIT2-like isoform X2 n=1 Tax=Mya arenaria TaxID=6604 RepID=UPI0022E60CD5|nr:omega-amidase NIT2-like isoform X2 [Mya arenaria]XP_052776950.1 omega-amidase NIT2-like isoform X2 [Mya arenaria]
MTSRFRLALVQLFVERRRHINLERARSLINRAAKDGAQVVVLPEYFTCMMDPEYFVEYKETRNGPTCQMLARAAHENNVYLFGGTFPEEIPGSKMLNNTCQIFNPKGDVIGTFRKLHLFDVDLGERMKITESELNMGGPGLTTVDTEFCRTGFGVCLDLRYPELARLYAMRGCQLMTYMGGFSLTTGPAHLQLLQRARAVDNQMFVANVGPATNNESPYVTYGHSAVADPWGNLIAETGSDEDVVIADIDLSLVAETRRRMPIDSLRRNDLFETRDLKIKQD